MQSNTYVLSGSSLAKKDYYADMTKAAEEQEHVEFREC